MRQDHTQLSSASWMAVGVRGPTGERARCPVPMDSVCEQDSATGRLPTEEVEIARERAMRHDHVPQHRVLLMVFGWSGAPGAVAMPRAARELDSEFARVTDRTMADRIVLAIPSRHSSATTVRVQ